MEKHLSYFSTKTYLVGTQKNRLNETVLLSIITYAKLWVIVNCGYYFQFYSEIILFI